MARPQNQPVQVPGATQPDTAQVEGTAPGQPDTAQVEGTAPGQPSELELLRAQLAAKDAEIASLQSVAVPTGETFAPAIAPHGAKALAESEFRGLTTSQVHAKVKAGEISLAGRHAVLCADGYYCNPAYR